MTSERVVEVVGVAVRISARLKPQDEALITANFSAFEPLPQDTGCPVHIRVSGAAERYLVEWLDNEAPPVETARDELIHQIENVVVIAIQLQRPDLLFMHSAALYYQGRGFLISGDSGNGKSTLCWALTHHRCRFLSDELAPMSVNAKTTVTGYPHALNLKRSPAAPYAIPEGTPHTGWTYHIPAQTLPAGLHREPAVVECLFLISLGEGKPSVEPLSAAEAAFLLYPNLLNSLAHPSAGLEAARKLAQTLRVYRLVSADLGETCQMVLDTVTA